MVRAFIALDIPDEIKDYIYDLQRKLSTPAAKLKWVSKKHLHFTIKFLGEIKDSKVPIIVERLSKIERRPLKVKLSRIGFFPDENFIRVVWLGIDPEEVVNKVQQDVDAELLDEFPDDQKFLSHITLGRIKEMKNKEYFLKLLKETKVPPMEFEFSWLKLYESLQKGATIDYRYMKEF